jgi:receptor protein-tyrosine kinase
MSAEADELLPEVETEMSEALIARCHLTAGDVERIHEAMQGMRLSFTDAALHIGLITQDDLDDVIAWVNRLASQQRAGPVEMALRRQARGRRVTVRQGDQVRPGAMLVLAHDPDNPRSERIRALRTELLLLNEGTRTSNAMALLSAGPAEGRSQLAAELAIAFAQLGRRTLLVDADLRHPRQHVLFGADNQWGLAQALAHGEPPHLHGVERLPHLSLLTSGAIPPNPLELLSDGRFERMLTDWRYNYEFIILDTPPVSQYADGLAAATLAGHVLVCSRTDTSFGEMRDMMRRLATTQSKILGAVLNRF